MKKLFFLSAFIAGSLSIQSAKAQIGVHLNVNLGPRPVYVEPAPIEDNYYYLPDADAYYSVPEHVYYYENDGRWISGPRLIGRYRDYDYDHMRHYVINEPRPYLRNDYYRERFRDQQFAGRYDVRDQNYGRSYERDHDHEHYEHRGQNYDNGYYRGGRDEHHDHGNHNGWYNH